MPEGDQLIFRIEQQAPEVADKLGLTVLMWESPTAC